jgi:hypothetical protein
MAKAATFTVPESRVGDFRKALGRLGARARKLGLPAPNAKETGATFAEERRTPAGHPYVRVLVEYETVGVPVLKLEGWEFLARIEHLEGGNFVFALPGQEAGEKWFTAPPACDHCRSKRRRKDTFLVRGAAGEVLQVGSTCLADFLGHRSPEHVAGVMSYVAAMAGVCSDWEEEGDRERDCSMREHDTLPADRFLATVAAVVRWVGWVSRGEAWESYGAKRATVDTALSIYFNPRVHKAAVEDGFQETEQDLETARAALAWAESLPAPRSDYERNLKMAAALGRCTFRGAGILASAIVAHARHLEKESTRKAWVEGFAAPVKARKVFSVTVTGAYPGQGAYGPYTRLTMRAASGHCLVWFATAGWAFELKVGEALELKATVREHKVFNGVSQTVLSRAIRVD